MKRIYDIIILAAVAVGLGFLGNELYKHIMDVMHGYIDFLWYIFVPIIGVPLAIAVFFIIRLVKRSKCPDPDAFGWFSCTTPAPTQ